MSTPRQSLVDRSRQWTSKLYMLQAAATQRQAGTAGTAGRSAGRTQAAELVSKGRRQVSARHGGN